MTLNKAKDFNSASEIAANLGEMVVGIRAVEAGDSDTLDQLKPLEELICFYEVDPGGVSLAELKEAQKTASMLYHSRRV